MPPWTRRSAAAAAAAAALVADIQMDSEGEQEEVIDVEAEDEDKEQEVDDDDEPEPEEDVDKDGDGETVRSFELPPTRIFYEYTGRRRARYRDAGATTAQDHTQTPCEHGTKQWDRRRGLSCV